MGIFFQYGSKIPGSSGRRSTQLFPLVQSDESADK
jgi:hypothetical protein